MSEYIMQGTRADQGKEKYGGKGNINWEKELEDI